MIHDNGDFFFFTFTFTCCWLEPFYIYIYIWQSTACFILYDHDIEDKFEVDVSFIYLFYFFWLNILLSLCLFFVRVCKREFYKDEWIIQNKIERKIYAKKTSNHHHHHHQEILILKPVSLSVCVFLCEASYVLSWMLNVDHHWTRES